MTRRIRYVAVFLGVAALWWACKTYAASVGNDAEQQSGVAVLYGNIGDPLHNQSFFLLNGFLLLDYERVWGHPAPDPLRFKLEASMGATQDDDRMRLMSSAGVMALHYLPWLETEIFRPYVEAGVGIIYTDFQVKGQGLRVNFNPQAGLGTEIRRSSGGIYLVALRVHHISNGGLHVQNRGINSGVLMVGKYF